jgi:ribosomal protein L13
MTSESGRCMKERDWSSISVEDAVLGRIARAMATQRAAFLVRTSSEAVFSG